MDPEMFGNMVGNSVASGSGYGAVPTDTDFEDAAGNIVDSSGNALTLGQGLQIGGDVLGAAGDLMAGSESKAADDYNAQLALEQGQFEVMDLNTQEADTLATQKAVYSKAGVMLTGSPLDTAVNTAGQFEMDKQIATYNSQSKANMDVYEGKVAESQAEVKAGGALLSGAEQGAEAAGLALMLL